MSDNKGMVDFAEIWGTVCSSRDCSDCGVTLIKSNDMSCSEFARKFPKKFVSIILDEHKGGITYAQEYSLRFPDSVLTAEDLAQLGMCRRALFEGYLGCETLDVGGDDEKCTRCWKERYIADTQE